MVNQSRPEFGTDGVRGTFGETLTSDFVFRLGQSIAKSLGVDKPFLVGRDTRISGPVLANALMDGLVSEGAVVENVGILPTPGVAYLARKSDLRACCITASHNPAQDNGVKVFDVGGVKIDAGVEKVIESTLDELLSIDNEYEEKYEIDDQNIEASKEYVNYLLDGISGESLEGLKIVLDCANGAAFSVAPGAFVLAGAKVIPINVENDGVRINDKCGATHLEPLIESVLINRADIGFAFDGDADRLVVVDNKGKVRDGDFILGLFALEMKQKGKLADDTVVATSMSNGALKEFLGKHEINFAETQVGDKYVLEELLAKGFTLGGEQSGHIIRRDFAIWGDGTLNALLVASILKERRQEDPKTNSGEMFFLFTPFVQLHDKVSVPDKSKSAKNLKIQESIEAELVNLGQGSRVIIRPSGTEDVVRITVEGLTKDAVQESLDRLSEVVTEECS